VRDTSAPGTEIWLIEFSLGGTETVRGRERYFKRICWLRHESLFFQTASSLMMFIVAVLLRPEIQTMAQKELDVVTRRERLPTFEDRPELPFVDAICKEVLRWRPIAPLGELPSGTHPLAPRPHMLSMRIHRFTSRNDRR
jgi:hypothetical protein